MPPGGRSATSGPNSRFFLYSALLIRKAEIGQRFATATAAEHLLRAHCVGLSFLGACWGEASYTAGHTRRGNIACASFLGDLASFFVVSMTRSMDCFSCNRLRNAVQRGQVSLFGKEYGTMVRRGEGCPVRDAICPRWTVALAVSPRGDGRWRRRGSPFLLGHRAVMKRLIGRARSAVFTRGSIGGGTPPVINTTC